ncbi:glutathione S-transferase L3 [Citrus sinensis]|nr:glutathione S-transferase L3 [Citrus sinensis]
MATTAQENLPPPLDSKAELPPLFDGTPRLYISYSCPFAQRAWITRNYKLLQGLQDKIKLVPLNLQDRPAWYKEKVYPVNKVPALEHNGKVIGESLDLIKYIDSNFEGPSLLPDDPEERKFADELFSHVDTFTNDVYTSFKGDPAKQAGPAFDYLEKALDKFDDGPCIYGCVLRSPYGFLSSLAYTEEAERITQSKGLVFCLNDVPGVYRVWMPNGETPGLAISRALGDYCVKDYGLISVLHVTQRNITTRDQFVILASDGVWDVISNQEAVEIVSSVVDREKAAKRLVECAVRAWKYKKRGIAMDDISAICLFFHSSSSP